jgi:hypothetical protein
MRMREGFGNTPERQRLELCGDEHNPIFYRERTTTIALGEYEARKSRVVPGIAQQD